MCLEATLKSILYHLDIIEKVSGNSEIGRGPLFGASDYEIRLDNVLPGFTQKISLDLTFLGILYCHDLGCQLIYSIKPLSLMLIYGI